jgi:hypothetical protein
MGIAAIRAGRAARAVAASVDAALAQSHAEPHAGPLALRAARVIRRS